MSHSRDSQPSKIYLGDAVYVDFDGWHIVLTTEDGISETNRICLEPSVYESLRRYAETIWRKPAEEAK